MTIFLYRASDGALAHVSAELAEKYEGYEEVSEAEWIALGGVTV